MATDSNSEASPQIIPAGDAAAIEHLAQAIAGGEHWYIALLQAISIWETEEETYNGRTCRYLISNEAFDWLLLAERLCDAVDGKLPDNERNALLFYGNPPLDLPVAEFKELIGSDRFRQHLNFFYGIAVEEALVLAVQEEVRKEMWTSGYLKGKDGSIEAYHRIYGTSKTVLLWHFRGDRGYPQSESISLQQLKEFTYWLFKYRFQKCDRTKVASDTRKALDWINKHRFAQQPGKYSSELQAIDVLPDTVRVID